MKTTIPNVGAQIRTIRTATGLSLRALAESSGLSVNTISLIERGENSATVSSLHLLAEALGVPITEFFQHEDRLVAVQTKRDGRLLYQRGGVTMESLGLGLRDQQLQPFLITVEPGCGNTDAVTHPGEEFVHCLAGDIKYRSGRESYRLEPGDSLLLDATRPHAFQNTASTASVFLVVFQSGVSPELGRERHLQA